MEVAVANHGPTRGEGRFGGLERRQQRPAFGQHCANSRRAGPPRSVFRSICRQGRMAYDFGPAGKRRRRRRQLPFLRDRSADRPARAAGRWRREGEGREISRLALESRRRGEDRPAADDRNASLFEHETARRIFGDRPGRHRPLGQIGRRRPWKNTWPKAAGSAFSWAICAKASFSTRNFTATERGCSPCRSKGRRNCWSIGWKSPRTCKPKSISSSAFSPRSGIRSSNRCLVQRYFAAADKWQPPDDGSVRVLAKLRNGAPLGGRKDLRQRPRGRIFDHGRADVEQLGAKSRRGDVPRFAGVFMRSGRGGAVAAGRRAVGSDARSGEVSAAGPLRHAAGSRRAHRHHRRRARPRKKLHAVLAETDVSGYYEALLTRSDNIAEDPPLRLQRRSGRRQFGRARSDAIGRAADGLEIPVRPGRRVPNGAKRKRRLQFARGDLVRLDYSVDRRTTARLFGELSSGDAEKRSLAAGGVR